MKNRVACIVFIFVLSVFASAADSWTTYKNIGEYKKSFMKSHQGLFPAYKYISLDINNDGFPDTVFYFTQGEETWVVLLVSKQEKYIDIELPPAEEYRVVTENNVVEFELGTGTFPMYGNPEGSDKYCWYDYYILNGFELTPNNQKHLSFYKTMILKYEQRIKEIETYILTINTDKNRDQDLVKSIEDSRRKHIARYKFFINKARLLINNSESN